MADSGSAPKYVKFIIASTSGMGATAVCYPLDVVKFRMQVSGEMGKPADHANSFQFAKAIIRDEGVFGLYKGLSASLLRQATYTGTRLGVYQSLLDYFQARDGRQPSVFQKVFSGLIGGIAGGFVGVPSDVAMTRMATDGRLPKDQRRNYSCVTNALSRIYKEEGFTALFRGTVPTITRAVVVNISQFVTYSQTKYFLISYGIAADSLLNNVLSSVMATCICTICAMPPDIAKTRLQNMKIIDGKPQYNGIFDTWIKIVKTEGPTSLYKGFTPMFLRSLPKSVLLFLIYETQFRWYRQYKALRYVIPENEKKEEKTKKEK